VKESVRQISESREQQTSPGAAMNAGDPFVSVLRDYGAMASRHATAPATAAFVEASAEAAATGTGLQSAVRGLVNVFVVFMEGTPGAEERLREVVTRFGWMHALQACIDSGSGMPGEVGPHGQPPLIEGIGVRADSWLSIDEGTKSVRVNGGAVDLSRKEYDALLCLYRKNGAVCSRDELIDSVWPEASNAEGVSDAAIDQLVHRLRRKVETGKGRPAHLLSRKGFGFLLV
jgi:DNA-binding winged helix-turn-helix (wHTH) protein